MDNLFKEIENTLKESVNHMTELLFKGDNIKTAIKTLEDENISLPEGVYGLLAYYESEYNNENKEYQKLLRLRDKIKNNN